MREQRNRIADKVDKLANDTTCAGTTPPTPEKRRTARSLQIAQGGLRTGFDTINMLTATITDVLEENVTTNQANVVVNAIGKVLKVVELQHKYGRPRPDGRNERDLVLIDRPGGASVPLEH